MGRSTFALTFSSAAYIATGYVITVVLGRTFGPAMFAVYSVVLALLTVTNLVVSRGVPVAASRAIALEPAEARSVMRAATRTTARLAAITAIATLVVSWPAGAVLGDSVRLPLQVGALAAATFGVQALVLAPLNGLQRFGWQAATRTLYAVARLVLVVGGALVAGVGGAIAGWVVAPLVASLPALPVARRAQFAGAGDAAMRPSCDRGGPDLGRQAVPLVMTSVWVSLLLTVDLIAFKAVGGNRDAGVYAAAAALAHVPFYLMAALPVEVMPRVAAAEWAARRALATRLLDDALILVAVPMAALFALGPLALGIIFGDAYAAGAPIVAPLAIATAAVTMHSLLIAVDAAYGGLRAAVLIGAGGCCAMAAAVAVAGASSGPVAAAWSAATVTLAMATVHWAFDISNSRVGVPGLYRWRRRRPAADPERTAR